MSADWSCTVLVPKIEPALENITNHRFQLISFTISDRKVHSFYVNVCYMKFKFKKKKFIFKYLFFPLARQGPPASINYN